MASDVVLAVEEAPPTPTVRAGGIHGTDRAVHSRGHALSSQLHVAEYAEDENCITCARARSCEPPNACANDSSSREDCGDMRRALGRGRIDTQHTWLFEWTWRKSGGNEDLKVV